ncbi:MAG: hypothetical protein AABY83_11060 [Pseudomonadota bacterium]
MIDKALLPERNRIVELLAVLTKESRALEDVRRRLFVNGAIAPDWLAGLDERPHDADMVESFAARFGRMQDTLGDKLFPRFLNFSGEKAGPMIDNLNKLEKLQFVPSAARWMAMRALRNKLVHEYLEDEVGFAEALNSANQFVDEMVKVYASIEEYVDQK